jgi:hypothetical protein
MNIGMKLIKDERVLKGQESEYKTKTAVGVGHFRTQKILRADKIEKLIQHPCHGASLTTMKSNKVSNSMRTNVSTRHTDAFFRFLIVGRANCLPTPANFQSGYEMEKGVDSAERTRNQALHAS